MTATAAAPVSFPRRQPYQDRSLLIYLADTIAANVGDTEITFDITISGSSSAAAPLTRDRLVPANPNFATTISATTEQAADTAWHKAESGNGVVSQVAAPSWLNGAATALKLSSTGGGLALVGYPIGKTALDASAGVVKFDAGITSAAYAPFVVIDVRAHDAAHAIISSTTTGAQQIVLFGTDRGPYGVSADVNLLARSTLANMKQTMILDLKSFLLDRMNSGKTWADVDHVIIYLRTDPTTLQAFEGYFNNFR